MSNTFKERHTAQCSQLATGFQTDEGPADSLLARHQWMDSRHHFRIVIHFSILTRHADVSGKKK